MLSSTYTNKLEIAIFFDYVQSAIQINNPLLIYLHGAGEKGTTTKRMQSFPIWEAFGKYLPQWNILAPICPAGLSGWPILQLHDFIQKKRSEVSASKLILMGASMGGRGVYEYAYDYAAEVDKIVALDAVGIPQLAERIKKLPTLIGHGQHDELVNIDQAMAMKEALPMSNLHTFNSGHGCLSHLLKSPDFWVWLKE
ncbi:MAG: hypothetical protein COA79_24175 [Planctomycetota bacterium]|nr:MAG: hypothetical protein COA79_24175 [Planctomycetota bacterium]